MDTLVQALAKFEATRKDDDISRIICSFAAEGMWPFDTGRITLWLDYNIDYITYTLWVQIERYLWMPFGHTFNDRQMYSIYDPEQYLLESVREPLIKHFRYRPSLPVEDHILLGED